MNNARRDGLLPDDAYNRELAANVRPRNWSNPQPFRAYNLAVIGAGTAGLVTAVVVAGLGAKVALVENAQMGGDFPSGETPFDQVNIDPEPCVIHPYPTQAEAVKKAANLWRKTRLTGTMKRLLKNYYE